MLTYLLTFSSLLAAILLFLAFIVIRIHMCLDSPIYLPVSLLKIPFLFAFIPSLWFSFSLSSSSQWEIVGGKLFYVKSVYFPLNHDDNIAGYTILGSQFFSTKDEESSGFHHFCWEVKCQSNGCTLSIIWLFILVIFKIFSSVEFCMYLHIQRGSRRRDTQHSLNIDS